jgi:spermidine/putrescine transport system ATP-binding protein
MMAAVGEPHPASAQGSRADARAQPRPTAVELRGVTVRYKGVPALNAVDLAIREGEFFSLLGPSGCGKTTTLNIIGGFVQPDIGDVLIDGRSVRHMPAYKRPVNTVFQSYALFPHMSVAENIGFGPRMAAEAPAVIAERVREALALVSLAGMEERRPSQLSGGQQQRVAVARALVNRPAVLLLDEPLGALDLKLRKQMQLELSRIQREVGITFIYVTHDQEEAMTMSDRIAVMNHGSVAQIGAPQEIYERPANLFVADFIGSSNILRGRVEEIGSAWVMVRLAEGDLVRVARDVDVPASGAVSVVVRPDHMEILADPAAGRGMNILAGRVTKVSFLGTHLQVSVTAGRQTALTLMRPIWDSERESPAPAVDSEVWLAWAPDRSLCFGGEDPPSREGA